MEQPLAREVAVLVRDSSWLLDKMLAGEPLTDDHEEDGHSH